MATKTLLVLLLVLIYSCSTKDNEQLKMQQKNTIIANQLFEYFNKHDWPKMANLYTDPAEFKDPSFGAEPIKQTRQQTIDKYSKYQSMSPDINDSLVQIYPSGDKYITVEFISSGTAPDGKKWRIPICTVFTIENGLITIDNTYYDNK
jgi:ketosteroid isomerase-like protein